MMGIAFGILVALSTGLEATNEDVVRFVRHIATPPGAAFISSAHSESVFLMTGANFQYAASEIDSQGHTKAIGNGIAGLGTDAIGNAVLTPRISYPSEQATPWSEEFQGKFHLLDSVRVLNGVQFASRSAQTIFATSTTGTAKPTYFVVPLVEVLDIAPSGSFALIRRNHHGDDKAAQNSSLGVVRLRGEARINQISLSGETTEPPSAMSFARATLISDTEAVFLVPPGWFKREWADRSGCILAHLNLKTGSVTRLKSVRADVLSDLYSIGKDRNVVYRESAHQLAVVRIGLIP